jgi:hypothetical protein
MAEWMERRGGEGGTCGGTELGVGTNCNVSRLVGWKKTRLVKNRIDGILHRTCRRLECSSVF